MITIVLTYRNREINIVKKCLESLKTQTNKEFEVVLVNYGSEEKYKKAINNLVKDFSFLGIINCEVQNQLWCKSRAINIALKKSKTPYIFVGDVDMIYHPEFVKTLINLQNEDKVTYFQVGFLSESESKKEKIFFDYNINFKSSEEATGMTLFNSNVLKQINGYDEYYHGWGSEDTDVHVRLQNAGFKVSFFENEILMLHQWHSKTYRNKDSKAPFHLALEKINQKYLSYTKATKKVVANTEFDWGEYNNEDYKLLCSATVEFKITNELSDVKGFIDNVLLSLKNQVVSLKVIEAVGYNSPKHFIKKVLGKKTKTFLSMQQVNNLLLESIITSCRNSPYKYSFNKSKQEIHLTIKL